MIQSVGMAVDRFGVALALAEDGELDQEQHDAVQDVFALSGACVLVRADLFRTIGGFNSELAVTGADIDLCWRIHASAARVVIVPSAVAVVTGKVVPVLLAPAPAVIVIRKLSSNSATVSWADCT